MNKLNIFHFRNIDFKELPPKYYNAIAALFYELGIDGKEYIENFIKAYINYAYSQTNKKSETILATGLGRRYVEKYLYSKIEALDKQKRNKRYTLFESLKAISIKSKNGLIPISGVKRSFNSIYLDIYGHDGEITSKTMLDRLITIKVLEKRSGDNIAFNSSVPEIGVSSINDVIRLLGDNVNRLSYTLIHNMNAENNNKTILQRSIASHAIPQSSHKQCLDEIRVLARQHFEEYTSILSKYEETEQPLRTVIESEGIEIGFSQFTFKNKT